MRPCARRCGQQVSSRGTPARSSARRWAAARLAYGALLLVQGRVEEAAQVYAADLGLDPTLARPCQHPGNVWSLHGYHECLQRLGRTDEAAIIGQQLALLKARADVPIVASCACRLEVCH